MEDRDEPIKYQRDSLRSEDVAPLADVILETAADSGTRVRYNARQGHGFAAEDYNTWVDRMNGFDAHTIGGDNAKNGADRLVDGRLIQTKYCNTARASVDSAFDKGTGQYKYVTSDGTPMQLEVPKGQGPEAIKLMEERIKAGDVPGETDPKRAKDLVREGNATYAQAVRLAKAGTIDSLVYDAHTGAVIAASAFGISATIAFASAIWNGDSLQDAVESAACAGLQSGGAAFAVSVITSQLTRTGLANLMLPASTSLVRVMPSGLRHALVNTFRNGAPIYGAAASGNLAKAMRMNVITTAVVMVVFSAGDLSNFFKGRISGKQLFKNVFNLAASLGGAVAAGAAAGSVLGPVGAIVGGIIGSAITMKASSALTNKFIEDDAIAMVKILNDRFVLLAQEYLLAEDEIDVVLDDLDNELSSGKLLEMFASEDRNRYADELLSNIMDKVTAWRPRVRMLDDSELTGAMLRVLKDAEDGIVRTRATPEQRRELAVQAGREILGREVSQKAATKAMFVTRRVNAVMTHGESTLRSMAQDEALYTEAKRRQDAEIAELRSKFERLVEEG